MTGGPPVQTPAWQPSAVVQALPSLQGVPGGLLLSTQAPLPGSQLDSLQNALALQMVVVAGVQTPVWQVSPWVQALWSSQPVPLPAFASTQAPVVGLQLLVLHGPLAVQVTGSPRQLPPRQLSPWVQALPSSQPAPSPFR